MFYSPLIEAICKWIEEQGTWVCWTWAGSAGALIGIGLAHWDGSFTARLLISVGILIYVVGLPFVRAYESRHEKKKKPDDKTENPKQ